MNINNNIINLTKTTKVPLLAGAVFVAVFGTLLHFVYEWSGQLWFVGLFCPVSESTFDHLKLFFFPMLLFSLFMRKGVSSPPFSTASLLFSTLIGTLCIPILFYTYRGILGYGIAALDISTFYISILLSFWLLYKRPDRKNGEFLLWVLTLTVTGCFLTLTYSPPTLGLFTVP